MEPAAACRHCRWQVICFLSLCGWGSVSGRLRYSVAEESEPGTLVGDVARDLGLDSAAVSQRKLVLGDETGRRYFTLRPGSGVLVVNEQIDRESLCGSGSSCLLTEEVIMESPLELFRLEVEILLDINDNAPSFLANNQFVRITELLATPGTRFPIESALDPDVGINTVSVYTLNPNPYFSLSVNRRTDGTLLRELVLDKVLDREDQESHQLVLTALDGGHPAKKGSSQITVIVMDINDNAPTFDRSTYTVSVLENIPVPFLLIKLNATDIDEGPNGEIEYCFEEHTLKTMHRLFSLDSHTGEIRVKGTIDYEEANLFEIAVQAKDRGVPVMVGRCILHVKIEDVNDNAPEILLKSPGLSVPENTPVGTAVAFLRVRDRDSGQNGEVRLEVSPNRPFILKPYGNHYSLVTDDILDRETISQYTLKLVATDQGSPPLQTQTMMFLNITDMNDNAPHFSQPQFDAYIKENSAAGSLLCTVSASDPDEGPNSQLTFSIVQGHIAGSPISSFVYISALTGHMYAQRSFDYEDVQELHVTIRVEDAGFPKLSSNVSVFVFVLDQNDNSPTILYPVISNEAYMQQFIPKDVPMGYLVSKVTAVDADSGHNAWLSYNLLAPTDTSLFRVSAHTGEIRSARDLRESVDSQHTLLILVKDNGQPSLSTTVTILLSVEDRAFQESPKSHGFHVHIQENSEMTTYLIISLVAITLVLIVSFIILLVKCLRKQDHGSHLCCSATTPTWKYTEPFHPAFKLNTDGTLKYLQVSLGTTGPENQCNRTCFSPASEMSGFTYMRALNFPQLKDMVNETDAILPGVDGVTCSQQVRDWLKEKASETNDLLLAISKICPSSFSPLCCQPETPQHLPARKIPHSPPSDIVSLSIHSPAARICCNWTYFHVCSPIRLRWPRDCSMISEPGTRAAVIAAALRLLPFCALYGFCDAQMHYSIPEELKRGAFVGNIAKDLGTDVAKLTAAHLQVLSDSDSQYFSVNVNTGVITVNDRIDREQLCGQSPHCLLNLKLAIENPVEVYSIEVEILDVNDNPPRFQSSDFTLNVNELASPGARFLIQNAQDPDGGSNSLQTYHLSPNPNFSLKVKTRADGNKFPELVLERGLDRERRAFHHLVLTAEDGGAPRRTSTLNITVNVLDANDNHPVFDKTVYKASLVENISKGTLVIRLNATDLDEGPNGEIEYSFSSHNSDDLSNVFTIDGQTGEIRIIGDLDYEVVKLYEIDIEAKDNGSPIMEEHCTVTVEIVDVNDNRPEISLVSLAKSVTEDSPRGTVVAVINIHDRDSGNNGKVNCYLPSNLPFTIRKDFEHQYSLITKNLLDRETVSQYNFSITATDMGHPPLVVERQLSIMVSDVNDSPPRFTRPSYEVFLKENNKVGDVLCTVSALDPDIGLNGLLSYSILRGPLENSDTLAYPIYINSKDGQVFAELPFDYEKISYFQFRVEVSDAGSPPLTSRTTVHVFILDQNDNIPVILYPDLGKDSDIRCQIPRSIGAKTLVTKITAVDPDAGRNAWVSYHLIQSPDPKLFTIGLRTGEIRTTRVLQDQDALMQELLLVIKDSGEPPLSTSVTVLVSMEDSGPEVYQGLHDAPPQTETMPSLTVYLIISLVIVSLIGLIGLVALGIKCLDSRVTGRLACSCLGRPQKPIDPGKHFLEHVQLHHSLGHTVIGVQVSSTGSVPSAPCRSCISPVSDISEFMFLKTSTMPPSCRPRAQLSEPSCSSAPNAAPSLNVQAKGMLPASQAHSAF
ncbi:LOW QUALITY PROTEIN: uncharacterized protein [Ambystoma mexicanum]|uniref:LOW QUALITY PROTEIN: uncharacterized protein n=1 Tax=Ambystoma mexicanum TaxID=8296 RepID=UPI0037E94459